MHGIRFGKQVRDERVARLVNCRQTFFFFTDNMAAPFRTEGNFFTCLFQFGHADDLLIRTGSQKSRFIQQIAEIGACKSGRFLGNCFQIDVFAQRFAFGMDVKNSDPALKIRTVYRNLPIKPAGTQKRRIKNIRSVRCGNRNDALIGAEAVHFNEQLV